VVGLIASIQALEAIKILSGNRAAVSRCLLVMDLWSNQLRQIDVRDLRQQVDCPACKHGELSWLHGKSGSRSAVLCGRNAVQLAPPEGSPIVLDELARKLQGLGAVTVNEYLLRLKAPPYELTIFPDGRTIIGGTSDVAVARTIYAKYVGS
jgi:adenylyltransferase/sulfurtransferase